MKKIFYAHWVFLVAASALLGNTFYFLENNSKEMAGFNLILAIPCLIIFIVGYSKDKRRQRLFDEYRSRKFREESDSYLASLDTCDIKFFYDSCEEKYLQKEFRYYTDKLKELKDSGIKEELFSYYSRLYALLCDHLGPKTVDKLLKK